jgi:hypothetical protein
MLINELITFLVAATILGFMLIIEPRLKGLARLGALSIVIVGMVEICLSPLFLYRQGSLVEYVLTFEPWNGGHVYTYLLILLVFLLNLVRVKDAFKSAMISALFVISHEAIWFMFYYALQPWLITVLPLIGDRAYSLWMLSILLAYVIRKYPVRLNMIIAVAINVAYQALRVSVFGFTDAQPVGLIELASWAMLALGFI